MQKKNQDIETRLGSGLNHIYIIMLQKGERNKVFPLNFLFPSRFFFFFFFSFFGYFSLLIISKKYILINITYCRFNILLGSVFDPRKYLDQQIHKSKQILICIFACSDTFSTVVKIFVPKQIESKVIRYYYSKQA